MSFSLSVPVLPPCFLNRGSELQSLRLRVRRELGVLARVALVFSRRGLELESMSYQPSDHRLCAEILLAFRGDGEQLDSVQRELSRLHDVQEISLVPQRSTYLVKSSPVAEHCVAGPRPS